MALASCRRLSRACSKCAACFYRRHSSLAFEILRAGPVEGSAPVRRGIVIHGLMGDATNLRPLCTRLLDQVVRHSPPNSPGWELVLVNLRNHGKSAELGHLKFPHNLQSSAKDIANLFESKSWGWPDVVIGHSFGGKVALEFGESCAHGRYGSFAVPPKQLWALDSIPAKVSIEQTDEMERILTTIRSLPNPVPSHSWLFEKLMEKGLSRSLAYWIGSNLKRIDPASEQMTWIFDVEDIYDMLLSYRQTSYWTFLGYPPKGMNIHIVRAEKSDRWSPVVIERLEKLVESQRFGERPDQGALHYHILKDSGHWVHVDNPSGLIDIVRPSLVNIASQ